MARRHLTTILFALCMVLAPVGPAAAVQDVTPARAEGPNRFATAAVVAGLTHPQGTTRAVIATSVAAADALAATPLAGALGAALLLTRPHEVPAETAQALVDLGVTDIILVGGDASIWPEVSADLQQDYDVSRIAGQREWDTAALVAEVTVTATGGLPQLAEGGTAFLANGDRFPDALASSAAAYAGAVPILYTTADTLNGQAAWFFETYQADHVVLLGGEQAISATVEGQLRAAGYATTRLAGPTRVETATTVATWSAPRFGFDMTTAILARGDDYADAVTSGQLGGRVGAPVVLTATPTVLPTTVRSWFAANCPTLEVVQAVGGDAAISVALFNDVIAAAESCGDQPPPTPPQPAGPVFRVLPDQPVQDEAGTATQFQVVERAGQPFTGPVDIVLFPCANAAVFGTGPDTFADADGDGGADGFGTTDTGFARIAVVNDDDIADTTIVVGAEPAADGILYFTMYSAEADCTVPVVIDGNGDGAFNVDADGQPIEPYGLGLVQYTA